MASEAHIARDPLMGSNHLTLMRWILASFVAIGHYWLLTTAYEPTRIYQWTGGYMAVNGFFMLSGLLIAKSLHSRNDLKSYFRSRLLRIYPALIVLLLAFAFIFSPFFSKPGGIENLTASETWQFVGRVLTMGDPQGAPGGIFADNLEKDFNGPLWTIRFEMAAYVLAALAFATKLVTTFWRALILFLIVQITYLALPMLPGTSNLPASILPLFRLSSCFLMGMVLWHWPRARNPHWGIVAGLFIIFLLVGRSFMGELSANLALAALLLKLGLPQTSNATIVKIPDYSYGIYIWHYPAMQAVLFLWPDLGPWQLLIVSTPIFLLLAGLSWHVIEKPMLKLKSRANPKIVGAAA